MTQRASARPVQPPGPRPGRNTLLELADDEVGDFGGDIAARAFRKGHGASPCGRGKGRRHGTTRRRQGIQEKAASGRESVLIGRFRFGSEEHTSELPSLMRSSYAVFCLKKK